MLDTLSAWLGRSRWLVPVTFAALLAAGAIALPAYGVTWDEPNMYNLGDEAYKYVFQGKEWPAEEGRRYHGPAFELVLAVAEKASGVSDFRQVTLLRHAAVFLLFWAGVLAFYVLGTSVFRDWRLGLLGAAMLALSPRIFAHAFVNSRDIPALALFIVGALTMRRMLARSSLRSAILHGLVCGFLLATRLPGLLLPALTILFLATDGWGRRGEPKARRATLMLGSVFLVVWVGATILFWPFLWSDPVSHFVEAWRFFRTLGHSPRLFMGRMVGLPWEFLPVWIAISTPIVYTLLFLAGLSRAGIELLRTPRAFLTAERDRLLALLWFAAPLVAIIATGTEVHDDWRHVFFVYPAFLLLSIDGLRWLWRQSEVLAGNLRSAARCALSLCVSLSLLWTFVWMIASHPLQAVYFSIPSRLVEDNFELDYWGFAFLPATKRLLALDPADRLQVHPTSSPGYSVRLALEPEESERLLFVGDESQAIYILDNFRRDGYVKKYPAEKELFSETVSGIKVLTVYKMR